MDFQGGGLLEKTDCACVRGNLLQRESPQIQIRLDELNHKRKYCTQIQRIDFQGGGLLERTDCACVRGNLSQRESPQQR